MTTTDERDGAARSAKDRSVEQVQGVDRLTRWCADALDGMTGSRSREVGLDVARRRDVAQRQLQAMCDYLDAQPDEPWPGLVRTAVLAHRQEWFVDKIAAALAAAGIRVVAQVSNGADVVGICAAEQPDLLMVEDRLEMLPGALTVEAVRQFSPGTRIVAQVGYPERVGQLLDAGASTAFARNVPPADVAAALLAQVPNQRHLTGRTGLNSG